MGDWLQKKNTLGRIIVNYELIELKYLYLIPHICYTQAIKDFIHKMEGLR